MQQRQPASSGQQWANPRPRKQRLRTQQPSHRHARCIQLLRGMHVPPPVARAPTSSLLSLLKGRDASWMFLILVLRVKQRLVRRMLHLLMILLILSLVMGSVDRHSMFRVKWTRFEKFEVCKLIDS